MAISKGRLEGIRRGLAALDQRLPMARTMDGRLPLHQDCRELLAEVDRLRALLAEARRGRAVALYLVRGNTGSTRDPEESYRPWERVDVEFDGIEMSLEGYVQEALPALKASDEDHPIAVRLSIEAAGGDA